MKKYLTVGLLLIVVSSLSGCLFVDIRRPHDSDYEKTILGSKEGKADTHTVLYLISWGDSGSKEAADSANIKVIHHSDIEIFSILFGLYTRVTTVVYGD